MGDHLVFDKNQHIIDNSDLSKQIAGLMSLQQIKRIEEFLELEFSDIKIDARKKKLESPQAELQVEKIFPNVLEVQFPEYLFIAKMAVDRDIIIKQSWQEEYKLKMTASDRKVIKKAMRYDGIPFFGDWYSASNQIITFRDLHSSNEPLTNYVDKGTVERIRSEEYWQQGESAYRNFIALLNFTFEELLRPKAIQFVYKEHLYRFASDSKIIKSRLVKWKKKNVATRTVIFEILDKEKKIIKCFRHFGFKARFQMFSDKWYLSINPTWSFTSDGYNKSGLSKYYATGLKRLENNKTIYYAFLFTAYCLNNSINLESPYPFMSFLLPVHREIASAYSMIDEDEEVNDIII